MGIFLDIRFPVRTSLGGLSSLLLFENQGAEIPMNKNSLKNWEKKREMSRKIKQYDKAITYLDDSQIIMKRLEEKKAS